MTPAELESLRNELPAFTDEAMVPSTALEQYQQFYQLDFTARNPALDYRHGLIPSGDFQLFTQCWIQPGASHNLLIVHGYFDHSGIYDKIIGWALGARCNVLVFDLPGHGLSSGGRADIEDFAQYGAAVADVLQGVSLPDLPLCALGQSTGCAALMEFARRNPWPFHRCAFLAPLVRPAGWLGARVAQTVLKPFKESIARKFNQNSSDQQFLDFVRRDPLQHERLSLNWIEALKKWLKGLVMDDLGVGPVLVVQGQQDGTVKWRYNVEAISQLFPLSRIVYLPEAGHQLVNETAALRRDYQGVLESWLFSQPGPVTAAGSSDCSAPA